MKSNLESRPINIDLCSALASRPYYESSKRIFDICSAVVGLFLLSPILFVIGFAVKLTSPGPVFYRGVRTGLHGQPFRIFKFRSMVVGAEMGAGTTSINDARITRFGSFIRRYKLDELPQILNILSGDMSLVGPRPELLRYTSQYTGDELLILCVRPGITDISSIRFSNLNDLIDDDNPDSAFEEKILPEKNRLRIKYVKERTFFFDIRLILRTFRNIIEKAC